MVDITNWLNMMERLGQANIPIISLDGVEYTPEELVEKPALLQQMALKPKEIDWTLLKNRIIQEYTEGKLKDFYTIGRHWTPEEMVAEVEAGTPDGIEFMMAEKKLIDELMKRM